MMRISGRYDATKGLVLFIFYIPGIADRKCGADFRKNLFSTCSVYIFFVLNLRNDTLTC